MTAADPEARAYYAQQLHLRPGRSTQVTAHCPFHDDRRRSLSVNLDTGLWTCHGGCGSGNRAQFAARLSGEPAPAKPNGHGLAKHIPPEVKAAAEQARRAKEPEAVYPYTDAAG